MAARLTQSRLWCYTLQMASDREFTLWIGTDKFLTVVPPFPVLYEKSVFRQDTNAITNTTLLSTDTLKADENTREP